MSAKTGIQRGLLAVAAVVLCRSTALASADAPAQASSLGNISTRGRVAPGDSAMIGGFIIRGDAPKRVLVRALGPSLNINGAPVPGALDDPMIELHDSTGAIIASNDNWTGTLPPDLDRALLPADPLEAALSLTLNPGAYTAVLRGVNNSSGVALVEAYDLDGGAVSRLANISTRGRVASGDEVMIGGFIVTGNGRQRVVVRALGPSLSRANVPGVLADPTLEMHDANGTIISSNNSWKETQLAQIESAELAPVDDAEAAMLIDVAPGAYTAIVRGENGGSGIALVEVYTVPGARAETRFHLDLTSGEVTVTPGENTDPNRHAEVFRGSTIVFNSSTLLDQAGDTGRKVINVSLTNKSGESIGLMPDGTVTGLRALFSSFSNVSSASDLRPKTSVSAFAGTGVAGSSDGAASSATLRNPTGLALDGAGNFYIADFANHKVRKISSGIVSTLAGSGFAGGADGAGSAATFNNPWGVAINPADGALIVTDLSGHRIRRLTVDGVVTTIAGTGVAGDTDGAGDVAMFRNPAGVVVDASGVIYLVESGGHRVRKIIRTGADPRVAASYTVSALAGSTASPPLSGSTNGVGDTARFNAPRALAIDPAGTLYVADRSNSRIRRVSSTGEVVTIAGTGVAGSADGDGNVATFNNPQGITVAGGALMVSDSSNHKLRQLRLKPGASASVPTSWIVQTLAGPAPGAATAGFADGPGDTALFNNPYGLASDGAQNLYVADFTNNRIRRVTPANGFFPVGLPNGSAPAEPVTMANADGVIPSQAAGIDLPYISYAGALNNGDSSVVEPWVFIIPSGVTAFEFTVSVEANTKFFAPPQAVSNPGPTGAGSRLNDVRTFAGSGSPDVGIQDGSATQARFSNPYAVAADAAGNLYIPDAFNDAIRRVSNQGFTSTVAGVVGTGSGAGDGSGLVASFRFPSGVATTPDGRTLFVADQGNHIIRRIALNPISGTNPPVFDPTNPANWSVTTIAGLAGAQGNSYGVGSGARWTSPNSIAIDPAGILYVSESSNRVRRIQFRGGNPAVASNWFVTLVAGDSSGTFGLSGTTDGTGGAARFYDPRGLAADNAGNLYVADLNNHRIRKISGPGNYNGGTVTTFAGSSAGYADGAGVAAQFNYPFGLAVDPAGYLWVSDYSNNRIRRISPTAVVETVAGTGALGGTEGTGDVATFNQPIGMAIDPSGNVYVTDNVTRIRIIQRILTQGSP